MQTTIIKNGKIRKEDLNELSLRYTKLRKAGTLGETRMICSEPNEDHIVFVAIVSFSAKQSDQLWNEVNQLFLRD